MTVKVDWGKAPIIGELGNRSLLKEIRMSMIIRKVTGTRTTLTT